MALMKVWLVFLWGNNEVEWTASNSIGASGGMVILWAKNSLILNFNFKWAGFVGINVTMLGRAINSVNVYAP